MLNLKPVGILGGTFDPIHLGHLHLANEVWRQINLEKIALLPCAQSPLRSPPIASIEHRLNMLKLAVAQYSHLSIEEFEIRSSSSQPSFTINTLEHLKATEHYKNSILCLIMGIDALTKFTSWHKWETILKTVHIIAVNRQDIATALKNSAEIRDIIKQRQVLDSNELTTNKAGNILLLNINPLPISSSLVRTLIKSKSTAEIKKLLPETVWEYILKHKLYE